MPGHDESNAHGCCTDVAILRICTSFTAVKAEGQLEMRVSGKIESLLLIVGLLLIGVYTAAYTHRTILSRAGLKPFQDIQAERPVDTAVHFLPGTRLKLDVSLWSEKRIAAYEQSLAEYFD